MTDKTDDFREQIILLSAKVAEQAQSNTIIEPVEPDELTEGARYVSLGERIDALKALTATYVAIRKMDKEKGSRSDEDESGEFNFGTARLRVHETTKGGKA